MSPTFHHSFADAAGIDPEHRKRLLGGKGAALVRMTAMDLPVPPGFVLTTDACNRVAASGWFPELDADLAAGIAQLQDTSGRLLDAGAMPLLVSVRSGAPVSMPGMMDTVLNAGMTDAVAEALGVATGNPWFGWDTARRFVQSYATIVAGVPEELMKRVTGDCLGPTEGRHLGSDQLAAATRRMRAVLADEGYEIPEDPIEQIRTAVAAVFASWESERARAYRRIEGIDESLGTAATIQMMTFGNLGDRSGTGVAFTRDPSTGSPGLVGDFLVQAQGEDVVAGTHSTLPVSELRTLWPDVADQLDTAADRLEADLADLADIEFTVEDGTLWMLQVRRGKRSPVAALRIAIDLAEDPAFDMTREQALERVADLLEDPPRRTNPGAADDPDHVVLATGLAASPGRVVGRLCTGIDEAIAAGARGESVILVRRETSPSDIAGMAEAAGLVTSLGGLVSHAAVVARSWGVPAVVGASALTVGPQGVTVGDRLLEPGEVLTVDGDRGVLLLGDHPAEEVEVDEVRILRRWQRDLGVGGTGGPAADNTTAEAATHETCERVLALKGAASAVTVADVLGCPLDEVLAVLSELIETESAQQLPGDRLRLLPVAAERVDSRYRVDATRLAAVIEPHWAGFHGLNGSLKDVVAAWQVRDQEGEEVPNDHSDADYDAAVIVRLRTEVHTGIVPIIEVVATAEARFARYRDRLVGSLSAIDAGDIQMVAHPLRDSYHTVWFDQQQELFRLTGRHRADEAAAGRA